VTGRPPDGAVDRDRIREETLAVELTDVSILEPG
jgi:hypothetical protein